MDSTLLDLASLKKTDISNEERNSIKEQINAEFDEIEAGKKHTVQTGDNIEIYLPPPSRLFELLGFNLGVPTIIELMDNVGVQPPMISRSSQYDLQGKGVGKKTYKKLIDWTVDLPISSLNSLLEGQNPKLDEAAKTSLNAYLWRLYLESMLQPIKINNDELKPEYITLVDFIEYRCDTEIAFRQYVRNRDDFSETDVNNTDIWWQKWVKPFYVEHTRLTPIELDGMDDLIRDRSIADKLTDAEKHKLFKSLLRLKSDFILTTIAHYEVGVMISYCPDESMRTLKPLACRALQRYCESDGERTCFYWVLQVIKDSLTESDPATSWKRIASYIPINPETDETEEGMTIEAKQIDRLKSWRKGKNLPSNKLLTQFIENMKVITKQTPSDDTVLIAVLITLGLDKQLANWTKEIGHEFSSKNIVRQIWKDTLSHYYDDYYLHYLEQHIAIKTQAKTA
jgi:hypothetical protein